MDDMRQAVVAVVSTFLALTWVSMGVRLYARYFLTKRRLGWDDSKLFGFSSLPLAAEVRVWRLLTQTSSISIYCRCHAASCIAGNAATFG
jgi:hypothetical protein